MAKRRSKSAMFTTSEENVSADKKSAEISSLAKDIAYKVRDNSFTSVSLLLSSEVEALRECQLSLTNEKDSLIERLDSYITENEKLKQTNAKLEKLIETMKTQLEKCKDIDIVNTKLVELENKLSNLDELKLKLATDNIDLLKKNRALETELKLLKKQLPRTHIANTSGFAPNYLHGRRYDTWN